MSTSELKLPPSSPVNVVEATAATEKRFSEHEWLLRKLEDLSKSGVANAGPKMASGAAIMAAELADTLWVIDQILHVGASVLAAKPKAGKSWLALQMAVAIAKGERCLMGRFHVERPGKVLYLALEDTHNRLQRRLRTLAPDGRGLANIDFVCEMPHKLDSGDETDQGTVYLRHLLLLKQYTALIIDTLPAAFEPITHRDVVRAQYAQSKLLRDIAGEFEIAVLVVQHMRKQIGDQAVDKVSGTSGVTAGLDSVLTLDSDRNGQMTLEITSRETEGQALPVKLDIPAGGWVLSQTGGSAKMTPEREDVRELLSERGPLAPKDIAKALRKGEPATRQLLRTMRMDGIIDKTGAKYHLKACWERDTVLGQAVTAE